MHIIIHIHPVITPTPPPVSTYTPHLAPNFISSFLYNLLSSVCTACVLVTMRPSTD